jgi:hypothetical protein
MGKTMATFRRNSDQRATTASKIPRRRQTSHAGKNDPAISKDGARLQPARSPVEQEITERTETLGWNQLELLMEMGS